MKHPVRTDISLANLTILMRKKKKNVTRRSKLLKEILEAPFSSLKFILLNLPIN